MSDFTWIKDKQEYNNMLTYLSRFITDLRQHPNPAIIKSIIRLIQIGNKRDY